LQCVMCNREVVEDSYCELHKKAYDSVVEKYQEWNKALEISWKEYLSEIVKNPLTGEWAKQVAEHLIRSGEK
jgi:hypothetical protein